MSPNNLQILFHVPEESEIAIIYEQWRSSGEDEQAVDYDQLTQDSRQRIHRNIQRFYRKALADGRYVGWITIIDRDEDPTINLGFYLFEESRGKGLMVPILKQAVAHIQQNHSSKPITAGTPVSNVAAIKSLERAGFVMSGTEEVRWNGSSTAVTYTCHSYPCGPGPHC